MDSRFNQLFSVFAIFIVVIGFGVLLNLDDSQLNNAELNFNNLFGSEGNVLTGAVIGIGSGETGADESVIEEVIVDASAAKGITQPIIVHSKNTSKNKTDKTSAA